MDLTLAMPRQRTTAPILAIAIIVSILMFPVLEHFLGSMDGARTRAGREDSERWNFYLGATRHMALRSVE
jgi:hypothetical protein